MEFTISRYLDTTKCARSGQPREYVIVVAPTGNVVHWRHIPRTATIADVITITAAVAADWLNRVYRTNDMISRCDTVLL